MTWKQHAAYFVTTLVVTQVIFRTVSPWPLAALALVAYTAITIPLLRAWLSD